MTIRCCLCRTIRGCSSSGRRRRGGDGEKLPSRPLVETMDGRQRIERMVCLHQALDTYALATLFVGLSYLDRSRKPKAAGRNGIDDGFKS